METVEGVEEAVDVDTDIEIDVVVEDWTVTTVELTSFDECSDEPGEILGEGGAAAEVDDKDFGP